MLGICCFNIILFFLVKYYYIVRNKRREEVWSKLTGDQKIDYINNTKEEGSKRTDFRFAH